MLSSLFIWFKIFSHLMENSYGKKKKTFVCLLKNIFFKLIFMESRLFFIFYNIMKNELENIFQYLVMP